MRLDKESLARAIDEEKKRKLGGEELDRGGKRRKNALQSSSHEVTEEELGMFVAAYTQSIHLFVCRGIPHESTHDGGSDGKLCRFRGFIGSMYSHAVTYKYSMYPLIVCLHIFASAFVHKQIGLE